MAPSAPTGRTVTPYFLAWAGRGRDKPSVPEGVPKGVDLPPPLRPVFARIAIPSKSSDFLPLRWLERPRYWLVVVSVRGLGDMQDAIEWDVDGAVLQRFQSPHPISTILVECLQVLETL